jgi:hypothetical protein
MLAPLFIILLEWCVVMLFIGWTLDVINVWRASVRRRASHSTRSESGRARQLQRNMPVRVVPEIHGDSLLASGVTNRRQRA